MSYRHMEVKPIAGSLGAEIYGVDLHDKDDSPMWAELHRAFLEYRVIAIRGQKLSTADMMRVGAKFGEPFQYPFARGSDEYPFVYPLIKEAHQRENSGNDWHTDTMYLQKPPIATLLYSIETPPKGGDTLFCNTADAYDALSDGMKKLLGPLKGYASAGLKNKKGGRAAHSAKLGTTTVDVDKADTLESHHPVVRTHPETGRKALYMSLLHTICFDGMTEEESKPIIKFLEDHCIRPEFTCRVRWEPGQLTVWDNRTTLHNAINDYHGSRREMSRLIVGPEVPA